MSKLNQIIILLVFILTININTVYSKPNPIHVEKIGKGKPILLLPGFTIPSSIWNETVQNLEIKGEFYFISYAGFNGNEPIEMPWYSKIKTSLIKYITDNKLSEIIIIGHSMGGNLAIDIAAEIPNIVQKIVIVDALPCMREVIMPGVPAENFWYDSPYNKQMLEMDSSHFKKMAVSMASYMTFKTNKIEFLTKSILEADRKTYVYGYTDLLKLDLRNTLSKVTCKALILGASFPDLEIAKKNYELQYLNLSQKIIIMASNSKHFIMFDEPEWFYEKLNEFLVDEK